MSTLTNRREKIQSVLDRELERWSQKSCEELVAALKDVQAYEVELDAVRYQIEVELLENTDCYIHVMVAVDDGGFRTATRPANRTFIRRRD